MPTYETHNGLTLDKFKDKDGEWRVMFFFKEEMDRAKTLYKGPDETAAQREYAKWKKHYEQRAKEEAG